MKLCIRCQTLKYPQSFRKTSKTKDGYSNCCKKCLSEMRTTYHYTRKRDKKIEPWDKKISDKSMCNILKYHKNVMDEDDERLHTQFIIDLINHKI